MLNYREYLQGMKSIEIQKNQLCDLPREGGMKMKNGSSAETQRTCEGSLD